MTTTVKILVVAGAAVTMGLAISYLTGPKSGTAAKPAANRATDPVGYAGLIDDGAKLLNSLFSKPSTPAPAFAGSNWNSTPDLYLPLSPGETPFADDTSHDYLLD